MTSYFDELDDGPVSELTQPWSVPKSIELDKESLVWDMESFRYVAPTKDRLRDMLGEFIRLSQAPEQRIKEFASKWGILGICRHGLPCTHNSQHTFLGGHRYNPSCRKCGTEVEFYCNPQIKDELIYTEPIEAWRRFSTYAEATVRVAIELQEGKTGDRRNWEALQGLYFSSRPSITYHSPPPSHEHAWFQLSLIIDRWLEVTGAIPRLSWTDRGTTIIFSSPNGLYQLPTVLAVQLMLRINQSPGFALCSSCGKPFTLRRGQSSYESHYCNRCGMSASQRLASARYRQRQREDPNRKKRKMLTDGEKEQIRKSTKNSKESFTAFCKRIARKYGVSDSTIRKTIRRAEIKRILES